MKKIINVGIIGLGYVGAPLAYLTASKGYRVIGIDKNIDAINQVNKRINIPYQLREKRDKLNLEATNDYTKLIDMDIIIICVPTPTMNNIPDLTSLKNVVKEMKDYIKLGCLIIVESTVAPGMTKKYIIDYLLNEKGFKINEYYSLAYCPERIDPGNDNLWVGNINRVCGSTSKETLNKVSQFYKSVITGKIVQMDSIEEAELVKVWENSMRNVSIAQANLLAIICDRYNFSVKRILNGLNSKIEQFGNSLSYPGIGVGGHCIPEDIHYLINVAQNDIKVDMKLLKEAVNINENMPQYAYDKLLSKVKENNDNINLMKTLMLGISYKSNSEDTRRSQALVLYDIFNASNKNISIYDPIVQSTTKETLTKEEFERELNEAEIIILSCAHDVFLDIDYAKLKNVKYILDCWNKLDAEKIKNSGINYIGVGI